MGIFDFLKKFKTRKQDAKYIDMLDGTIPIYSQGGTSIYSSDVVQQALYTIVKEMSKLNPKHIRTKGFDPVPVDGSIQRVLDAPNYLMTTSEFIEKITWNLLLNYNSFIYVQRDDDGELLALYPLSPDQVTFLENGNNQLFIKMHFKSGYESTVPYDKLIHLRSHYSVNDLMGGNDQGQPNYHPLFKTLQLNDALLNGLKKALNASFAINGIVKYNTMLDNGEMDKKIKDFERRLQKSQSGILGMDNKAELIQLKRDISMVDDATLSFIDDKILRNFGVPLEVVRGNYTTDIYESFYQSTLEPLIISFSQGFTKKLFTKREKDGFKNEVKLYPKELVFMNTTQTLNMVNLLGQSGALFENEKRVAFGYAPIPELVGVRLQSLNYVDVNIAKDYQLNNKSNNVDNTEENDKGDVNHEE